MQYVGQTLTTAFWFFVFWYGGWALLWSYGQISTPPSLGWWDWALPVAAIFAVVERFSVGNVHGSRRGQLAGKSERKFVEILLENHGGRFGVHVPGAFAALA